jgi:DNA polymerase
MFKIKSSFADCLNCELFECYSCVLDTNCKTFDEVDVIFIAENPGKTEVESEPPIPLIGKSGQLFRKYFKLFSLDRAKYLITNVVLCQTLLKDGTTGNPSDKTIEMCKVNCFEIIKQCNPKLIVLMGGSAATAFGLFNKGDTITKCRGNMYKWNDIDLLLTFHPSYVNRNKNVEEEKFKNDIKKSAEIVGTMKASSKNESIEVTEGSSGVFHYSIPNKYYTSDYKLVDVQYLNKTNEVLYIFRDKDNNKIYHKENDLYVCYKNPDPSTLRPVVSYDKLN